MSEVIAIELSCLSSFYQSFLNIIFHFTKEVKPNKIITSSLGQSITDTCAVMPKINLVPEISYKLKIIQVIE